MNLNFTKLVPVKSYEHVVEQIQNAICEGTLKQGERLPSEMKLKEMFSTSRGTVREALRVLEQKGLVGISTGVKGGATVKGANTEAMSDSMALLIRHQKVSLEHLAEFREFLEVYAAEKAAEIGDGMEIAGLKGIISQIQALIETDPQDWGEFHRLDALFHQKLAAMAENPLIEANLVTVHDNIQGYFHKYLPFSRELLHEDFEHLCEIAAAVERGDRAAAGRSARQHIVRFSGLMKANMPENDEADTEVTYSLSER
ncbi:FadR/GntR family transcriptional regulator [Desulfopila inferna]|uniref:FadR/GntR family transcriptional regulator n=1 Tax=Desulfopila inferna TaxID=468528 RepID=UPI0019637A25|nr:FCD domain-containing protein [Desulfopila inferna]MBM9604382.1 FadR family transcriptional regulator [Desulfopila inferna]